AYAALAGQLAAGELVGRVTTGGAPVAGVAVTITTSSDAVLEYKTDADGCFLAWLRPGAYTLQAGEYGYTPSSPRVVSVQSGETAHHELVLSRLAHGTITGHATDAESADPLSNVEVVATGTPISTTTDAIGAYTLTLPTGRDYTIRAWHNGFRLDTATTTLVSDAPVRQDFRLEPSQTILLVDSGRWYYDSHASYFRQALIDAGYAHDEWHVYAPGDTPALETLQRYDSIVWTAPQDGPAWSGGGDALAAYLEEGGNLFVSGQEVARLDGVGTTAHRWFTRYLRGSYIGNPTAPYTLTGVSGTPYAGAHFVLNGDDSAANQIVPARVAPQAESYTRPLLTYAGDTGQAGGALQGGWCEPHRVIFLGFGLEGAGTAAVRRDLVQGALDHFQAPPVARAIDLEPKQVSEVVLPGQTLTVTFNVHNLSEVHTSTIQLDYASGWPSNLSQDSLQLGPCQQQPVTMTLQVPADLAAGARQEIELTARADYGAVSGASVVASAPAPALLVADYRWYDETAAYRTALHEQGIDFDVWDTNERGSPALERLSIYETVLWYTGYDWFEPLTEDEIDRLEEFLQEGGRLFLSSQDYLYYHRHNPFTRDYLGVQGYQESITATAVFGGDNALAGDGIEPLTLGYGLYRNFGDGVTPAASSAAYLWNNRAFASGVATPGAPWRTVFWGKPFELLPEHSRAKLLGNVLGWLGDLGDSTVEVTPRTAPAAESRQYTVTVRNWQHGVGRPVAMTSTLPSSLTIEPGSIVGGARFDAERGQILWEGSLEPGEFHTIRFRAQPNGLPTPKNRIDVTTTLSYPEQNHPWQHTAPTWLAGPDLSYSSLTVEPAEIKPDQVVTYTAFIRNGGSEPTGEISATVSLPRRLQILTDAISTSSGTLTVSNKFVTWEGSVAANNVVTISVAADPGRVSQVHVLPTGLIITDGVSTPIVRNTTVRLSPYRRLFPIIQR
ncbi:MAG: carboxypeptidase regulatory-like domain-containing protein, partial [Chloroflexota bacterium]